MARYQHVYCSQCGSHLGPGDAGVSHCLDHAPVRFSPEIKQTVQAAAKRSAWPFLVSLNNEYSKQVAA